MSTGRYSDWMSALGHNESGNNYSFVSSLGYLGRFQFGEEALKAIGFYGGDNTSSIDFIGSWTATAAAYGVFDKSAFLASPAAQDAAANAWFSKIESDVKALGLDRYEGRTVGGVEVTTSGLLAGAHLVGVWALKSYLESGGAIDTVDGYGTPVSAYVSKFGGFETPFNPGSSATSVESLTSGSAAAVTSVATLSYEFFTGHAPTAPGLAYLVASDGPNPDNLNSNYYQRFSLENRYINFAVSLGVAGDGSGAFAAKYGSLSFFDATREAYAIIFGAAPSDQKLHDMLDPTVTVGAQSLSRSEYLGEIGGGSTSSLGAKAAMVGWLLAEAAKADLGTYAHANDAFLTDVTLHNAPLGVDIVGVYAQPSDVFHPG
jgi:hypothetical protein